MMETRKSGLCAQKNIVVMLLSLLSLVVVVVVVVFLLLHLLCVKVGDIAYKGDNLLPEGRAN